MPSMRQRFLLGTMTSEARESNYRSGQAGEGVEEREAGLELGRPLSLVRPSITKVSECG